MAPCGTLASPTIDSKESASKRKRANRLAKLRQFEARREQCLSHQGAEHRQGQEIPQVDTGASVNDSGEIIHPEPAEAKSLLSTNSTITWASLLNSSVSAQMEQSPHRTQRTQLEPDPDLLCTNSNAHVNLRIRRTEQKTFCRNTSPGFTCDGGCAEPDASPKPCEDRSPKSKASKVRRSRGHRRNSKENTCFDNLETRRQQRQFEAKRAHAHEREHAGDGWEAAADTLGLHTAEKKKFSNVLQPQIPPLNDHQHTRITSASLLGLKPNKQQQKTHRRAWIQGDLRRPTCLPSPSKQQSSGIDMQSVTQVNDSSEKPQCLICTEDLDITDTSFEGCDCGFNICLFCYHKIAQETRRCPGCRGVYKQDVAAKPVCLLPR